MNKKQFIDAFMDNAAEQAAIKITSRYQAEKMINVFFDTIYKNLEKDGSIKFVGFGEFVVADRKGHVGCNPKTGQTCKIPAHKVVKFKAGKTLRDSIEG